MANRRELTIPNVAGRTGWRPIVIPRKPAAAVGTDQLVVVMIAFWIIAILGGSSRSTAGMIQLAFTPAAFAVGFWFWRVSAGAYLGFVWQLFFFSCLIRRLVDYQLGWNPVNPVIIAPYVAALWCGVTLLRPCRLFLGSFGLVAVGLLWALSIGIVGNGISAAAFSALEWGAGPLIAGYLLTIRADSQYLQKSLFVTAILGVTAMTLYGVVQEIWLPAWDQYWISSAGMGSVIGLDPGTLRVFSTMNSPWPFGATLMALLVFVMGMRGRFVLRSLAVASGLIALITTQTRAAWGGFVVGWLVLTAVAGRARGRLVAAVALLVLIGAIAIIVMPSGSALAARLATLTSLGSDDSLAVRMQFYQAFLMEAFAQPLGSGLGRTGVATRLSDDGSMLHFDSGLMNVPFVLGWVGALAYVTGLSEMGLTVIRRRRDLSPAGLAAGAACVALLAQMLFLNSLIAASGVMFWTFLGVCLRDVSDDQPAVAISRLKSLAGK